MSDRLKTDLYTIWDRGRHGISWEDRWVQDFIDDIASDPAAARRFLALTETGPDYEAAARALFARRYGSDESFGGLAKDDVYRKMAHAAVDAAVPWLSDSLPDRPGQRIEWCETHECTTSSPDSNVCMRWGGWPDSKPCHLVSKWLSDYTKEE